MPGSLRGAGDSAASPQETSTQDAFAGAAPSDLIWGRHSTQAALESGRPLHRIWCTPELRFSPRFLQLLREAKASGVLVEEVTWARLGQISGGAVHQGIVVQPAAAETLDLPSLVEGCRGLGEAPLLIAVDGLTDPQNLGAIVRSAEALGAHGMVLPQRRNAGLTGSVAKVAAGALEHLPVARVVNLNRALDSLKQEGYRVVGLAAEGTVCLEEAELDGPLVLVTGSEGDGLSLLTRRSCDQLVRIPLRGSTPSLNASVATALLLYEVARRGWMEGLKGTNPAPRLVRPALPNPQPLSVEEAATAPEAETADHLPSDATGATRDAAIHDALAADLASYASLSATPVGEAANFGTNPVEQDQAAQPHGMAEDTTAAMVSAIAADQAAVPHQAMGDAPSLEAPLTSVEQPTSPSTGAQEATTAAASDPATDPVAAPSVQVGAGPAAPASTAGTDTASVSLDRAESPFNGDIRL